MNKNNNESSTPSLKNTALVGNEPPWEEYYKNTRGCFDKILIEKNDLESQLKDQSARLAELTEALGFYANQENYELRKRTDTELEGFTHHIAEVMDDCGNKARAALHPAASKKDS